MTIIEFHLSRHDTRGLDWSFRMQKRPPPGKWREAALGHPRRRPFDGPPPEMILGLFDPVRRCCSMLIHSGIPRLLRAGYPVINTLI